MENNSEVDWGSITPDGYNQEKNEALFVFNFDLSSEDKIENVVLFILGKVLWGRKHLPENCRQIIVFDIRGQDLLDNTVNDIVDEIETKISYVDPSFSNYSISFKLA